ncbi:adenylate cyclase type 10-like isoform X2 [Meleagris gallopavo]|uniref:adenylate cyclase type 10-like isoform X2 n=1 Tax=Meleagris gallopavo TaxID=9103 RepID=UPI0005499FF4|nr:adenylate cyclase type 10-like isoform X2 [Meleagris gallopavo]
MGDILEVVLDFGGDILKFAGDAVLVLWRAAQPHLPTAINLALQCSSEIQKKYGTHDTHMGLMLHLKIGTGIDGSAPVLSRADG